MNKPKSFLEYLKLSKEEKTKLFLKDKADKAWQNTIVNRIDEIYLYLKYRGLSKEKYLVGAEQLLKDLIYDIENKNINKEQSDE